MLRPLTELLLHSIMGLVNSITGICPDVHTSKEMLKNCKGFGKKATGIIRGLEKLPYSERLKKFNLFSFIQEKAKWRLDQSVSTYLERRFVLYSTNKGITRSSGLMLKLDNSVFLTVRGIHRCNSLPWVMVDSPSLKAVHQDWMLF